MPPKRSDIGESTNQAKRKREKRASETSEQRKTRQERHRVRTALARSLETSGQRQDRLTKKRVLYALTRSSETSEQRLARQQRERIQYSQRREMPQKRGRPKKRVEEPPVEDDKKMPRKRGRPKKRVEEPPVEDDKKTQIQVQTCPDDDSKVVIKPSSAADNESPKTNYQAESRLLVNVPEVIKHAEMPEKQFSLPHDSDIVEPKSGLKLDITYTPTTSQPVDGRLCIRVVPDGSAMKVPLKGGATPELRSPSSALSNPLSTDSRSGSPNISVPLSLESTTKSLVWGSVSRSCQVKRSCSLRNNSLYRERLHFTIVDPHNSFFFDIDGENKREFMITLDTMQTKEITVSLIPTILGPLVGTIQVTRIKNENEKKNIGLFGFGGRGLLRMGRVILDFAPGDKQVRMLLLNSSLTTDFTLHNFGDGESYFLIFQSFMEATCINALPSSGTIPVGSNIQINVSFKGDLASKKSILMHSKNLEIKLCTLLIVHGDEQTRLRLSKLYKKYRKKRDDPNVKHIMEDLGRIVKAFSGRNDFEESAQAFKDPLSSLQYLFHEGVYKSELDVLVNRRLLEEANVDSTIQYVELDNTMSKMYNK